MAVEARCCKCRTTVVPNATVEYSIGPTVCHNQTLCGNRAGRKDMQNCATLPALLVEVSKMAAQAGHHPRFPASRRCSLCRCRPGAGNDRAMACRTHTGAA